MNIRVLNKEGCNDVATLHLKYIKGFLGMLGIRFLEELYGAMVSSQYAFCLVSEESGKVVGFVSGTVSVKSFYKEFLQKNFFKALFVAFPNLLKPAILKKAFETLFYPIKQSATLPDAELLSIVVSKEYQGKGVAQKLFEELANEFRKRGINEFKVVVGADLIQACRFYEKMGGVLYSEIEVHKGERSKVYVWRF